MHGRDLEESERLIAKFNCMPGAKALTAVLDRIFVFIQPDEVKGLLELIRLKAWTRHQSKGRDPKAFEDFYL